MDLKEGESLGDVVVKGVSVIKCVRQSPVS